MNQPVRILYIHAPADEVLRGALEAQLAVLARQGLIEGWHAGSLAPGAEVERELAQRLQAAQIVLLLLSPDLFASDRDYALLQAALRQHDDRAMHLVPVVVRPVDWQSTPLGGLQVLPPGGKPITTWPNLDEAWLEVVRGVRGLIEPPARPTAQAGALANPYRGLAAFQEEHASLFFGREEVTRLLWQMLYKRHKQEGALRLVSVLGPSGSGKSSLARAGLVPLLRQQPLAGAEAARVVVFTPGERPIEHLARALLSLLPADALRAAVVQVLEEQVLRRRSEGGTAEGLRRFACDLPDVEKAPLVLLVDQFEEIYTQRTAPEEWKLFVELLLHAAADRERHVAVVITLRSDFFEDTRRHAELNRAIADKEAHVLVPVMSREELRRAIALPAAQQGRPLDRGTVELLLSEAEGRPGVLPLLEFALTRIWEGLGQGHEAAQTLQELGGVGGALAREAQRIDQELTEAERRIARRVFLGMVQLGEGAKDTRRQVRIADLVAQGETLSQVQGVLRRFAQPSARLVTLSVDSQGERAEVTHEALFDQWQQLRSWIEEGREDLRFHRRLTEASGHWEKNGRLEVHLWKPPDLDLLRKFQERARGDMTELQQQFLEASERAEQGRIFRKRRQTQQVVLIALLVAVAMSGLGLLAWTQRNAAERARGNAEKAQQQAEGRLALLYVEQGRQEILRRNWQSAIVYLNAAQQLSGNLDAEGQYLLSAAASKTVELARIFNGHTHPLHFAAFNQTGSRMASIDSDYLTKIWDTQTGRLITSLPDSEYSTFPDFIQEYWRMKFHMKNLGPRRRSIRQDKHDFGGLGDRFVAYSPDGLRLVTASRYDSAKLWDSNTGNLVATLSGHFDTVNSAHFSSNGQRIITSSDDGTARLWDGITGKPLVTIKGHTDSVIFAMFQVADKSFITGSEDGMIYVWDAGNITSPVLKFRGCPRRNVSKKGVPFYEALEKNVLEAFQVDSCATRIVSACEDGAARLWELKQGQMQATLDGHRKAVTSVAFRPDCTQVATASEDGSVRVWRATSGELLFALEGHSDAITSVIYSPDGSRILTASKDHTARLWNSETGESLEILDAHQGPVLSASYSSDGSSILTASGDSSARIWNGRTETIIAAHDKAVLDVNCSPDGMRLVSASEDHRVRIWDARDGRLLFSLHGHQGPVLSATYQSASNIFSVSSDGTARIWDSSTGALLVTYQGHNADRDYDISVRRHPFAAVSQNGLLVAIAQRGAMIDLVNTKTNKLLRFGDGGTFNWSIDLTFNRKGTKILSRSWASTKLWNAQTGALITGLHEALSSENGYDILSAEFSPNDQYVVTTDKDGNAQLWDGNGRKETPLATLAGHAGPVLLGTFSPDGSRILTASQDHTARLWSVPDGKNLGVLNGHTKPVVATSFSPDGLFAATAGDDGSIRLWNGKTGKLLNVLSGHSGPVTALSFCPGSPVLATASRDRTIRLWKIGHEERAPEQIAKLVRCYSHFSLINEQLVPKRSEPDLCQKVRGKY